MLHADFLERAAATGWQTVQIADNLPLADLPPRELDTLIQQAVDSGLSLEVGARGLTEDNLETHLAMARKCGAPLLRFVIDGRGWQPSLDEAAGIIRQRLDDLDRFGITLAIENHDRFLGRDLSGFIDGIGSPRVGICLDSVNSLGAGEGFDTVLEWLAPHTVNLHIKDYSVRRLTHGMGFIVEGTPAGQGFLPIPSLVERLDAMGRCGTAVLELWPPWAGDVEGTIAREQAWIDESAAYLRRFFPLPDGQRTTG